MDKNLILHNTFHIENAVADDNALYLEGYAAHYDRPNLNREIVSASSFDYFFSLYNENKLRPALTYEHDNTLVIGAIDELVSKDDGLFMKCHLTRSVPICDTIIPNVMAGNIDSFSSEGYIVDGIDGVEFLDNGDYYVKSFLLTAVSVVNTPADYDAKFSVRNYLNTIQKPEPKYITPSIILL